MSFFKLSDELSALSEKALLKCKNKFDEIDALTEYNQQKARLPSSTVRRSSKRTLENSWLSYTASKDSKALKTSSAETEIFSQNA